MKSPDRRPRVRRSPYPSATLVVAAFLAVVSGCAEAPGPQGFAVPRGDQGEPGPSFRDFLGSRVCGECHPAEFEEWERSTHGKAGGRPTAERVIAPFDGRAIRFSDARVTPYVDDGGSFVFRVVQDDGTERIYEVDRVVGGGFLAGGGSQAYFTKFPDGTLRFLPFDFSAKRRVWFCQTGGRRDRGWVPIDSSLSLADCGDWPPKRILGVHDRFRNCQGCHGSQIDVTFEAEEQRYRTRFTSLTINCESCHGPGRRHVELARSGAIRKTAEIGMPALATLEKDASLQVCLQCHAVKEEIEPGYLPGRALEDHFGLKLSLLSYRPFFPDGRVRLFAYQQTHLYSDCYVNGSMTCVDCHDPHGQRYRDVNGRPLDGRFDDGQCLGCHPAKAGSPERHTHHPPDSPGSRCVACHMPYLQEPDVGDRIPYARSDHTIPVPRPLYDERLGVENACRKCHAEQPVDALERQVESWYGTLKPLDPLVRGIFRSRGTADREMAARLLLDPESRASVLQASGLSYFLLGHLRPDMPALEPAIVERLKRLARVDDLDVRALALASLHLARGDDPAIRAWLAAQLEGLGRWEDAVRRRWVWILGFRGDAYLSTGEYTPALRSYQKAGEVFSDDPELLRDIGRAWLYLEAQDSAIAYFRAGVEVEPLEPAGWIGLGFAQARAGALPAAVSSYRRAIGIDPYHPLAHLQLANAYLRQGRVEEAVATYRQTVALDASQADAHFALGTIYARQGKLDAAIEALERGLRFDPDDPGARRLLRSLRERGAGR